MKDIVVNRLKLQWEPAVLDFHKNNRTVQTHSQSRKALYRALYKSSSGPVCRGGVGVTAPLAKHIL
jgi:hypothetical protein